MPNPIPLGTVDTGPNSWRRNDQQILVATGEYVDGQPVFEGFRTEHTAHGWMLVSVRQVGTGVLYERRFRLVGAD